MAVSIRLRRGGKKKQPFYRIVAADSRSPRDGRFIEILGYYNPIREDDFEVKTDRVIYWLGVGAQPSDSVRTLLKRKGLWKDILEKAKPSSAQATEESDSELKSTKNPDSDISVSEEEPEEDKPETQGKNELLEQDIQPDTE